jgi:hypothetical protein
VYKPWAICNALISFLAVPNIYWKNVLNKRKEYLMAKYAILEILESEEEIEAEKFNLPANKKETENMID